ncbi:proline-specific peptidase [Aspergillus piperis CBS 112811]|uniref:Proline-specific peptidase n=1 Tax=Aspergillus piperis CBS 112811 TaxID=1448313 RepID=A0A8G1R122_9EURO|nr:proline-specific peptidase [Aspergillus piperis CBS 112811]RAH56309.1 proline-specific peptidase [Aspergillus piperis CBS 112811]
MVASTVQEGTAPFHYASLPQPAQTWYRIYGDIKAGTPLVVLHGGPGFCHNYMLPLAALASDRAVILYDQIGNGLSSHYLEKRGDQEFWTVDLFIAELENLLQHLGIAGHFDLLGHSWGGMMGMDFAARQPAGLRRLILSNSPASVALWLESVNRLRATLPQEIQDTLQKCEAEGRLDSKEYEDATVEFLSRFCCRTQPWPEELMQSLVWTTEKDSTVAASMLGPSEFWVEGSLKNWSALDRIHRIQVPTLVINCKYDEAQDSAVEPLFWGIDKVKWITLSDGSHCPQFDDREKYLQVVDEFLGRA